MKLPYNGQSEAQWNVVLQSGGSGFTVFRGHRGGGIGNLLGSAFRAVMPFVKSTAKKALKGAARTGLGVLSDSLAGEDPMKSFETRGRAEAGLLLDEGLGNLRKTRKRKTKRKQRGAGFVITPRQRGSKLGIVAKKRLPVRSVYARGPLR
jgi:hypothetical protein